MGASDFCSCKSISDGSCFDSITFQDLDNLICPENTSTIYNKREFLSNSFNNNNNDITIDELIKKQAVNKIYSFNSFNFKFNWPKIFRKFPSSFRCSNSK